MPLRAGGAAARSSLTQKYLGDKIKGVNKESDLGPRGAVGVRDDCLGPGCVGAGPAGTRKLGLRCRSRPPWLMEKGRPHRAWGSLPFCGSSALPEFTQDPGPDPVLLSS